MTAHVETVGALAVGSSAVLGIVDWDIIIRSSLLGGMFVCECLVLAVLIHVIRQIHREKKEDECQSNQSPSETNQLVSLPFNFQGRLFLLLRYNNQQLRHKWHLARRSNGGRIYIAAYHLPQTLYNLMRFRIHKKRTMPNVES